MEFSEILNKNNDIEENLSGLSFIHTGDFLDKKEPDLKAVEFWEKLRKKANDSGAFIHLLAGNHEQEIWQKITNGENYGLPKHSLDSLCDLIKSLDLFYVDGPLMFLHAYPTVEFLRVLLHYKQLTGHHINRFNIDHYKKAFKSVEALNQYSYTRGSSNNNYLLYDPEDISAYYRKNGLELSNILSELEIDCVIHGHRPQRSGIQSDSEFSKLIPGIRMIGNDTKVKQQGIGATLVRMDIGRAMQVIFINSRTANKKNRKKLRHLLRVSVPDSATLHQQVINSQQYRELKNSIDGMSQAHKKNQLQTENKLQAQRTSYLLLQEELQERDELHIKTLKKLKSLEATAQQLENKLQKNNEQQPDKEQPGSEVSDLSSEVAQIHNKHSFINEQAIEALELSKAQLQHDLEKSNLTRRQAVDYLRLSHEASQQMTQDLKHCQDDKLAIEKSRTAILKSEQALKQQLEQPKYNWNVYVTIIFSILIGTAVFYLFKIIAI